MAGTMVATRRSDLLPGMITSWLKSTLSPNAVTARKPSRYGNPFAKTSLQEVCRSNRRVEAILLDQPSNFAYGIVDRHTARCGSIKKLGIRADQVAKGRLLADTHGYALAVIPINRGVD